MIRSVGGGDMETKGRNPSIHQLSVRLARLTLSLLLSLLEVFKCMHEIPKEVKEVVY